MSYLNVIADAIGVKPDHGIVLDIQKALLLAGYVVKKTDTRLTTSVDVFEADVPYKQVVAVRMQMTDGILGAEHVLNCDQMNRPDFVVDVIPKVLASSLVKKIQESAIRDISLAMRGRALGI